MFKLVVLVLVGQAGALKEGSSVLGRRAVLRNVVAIATTAGGAQVASASIETFPRLDEGSNKGNVLTSSLLETVRVRRQLDADSKYDELADPELASSPRERLAAVLAIMDTFAALRQSVAKGSVEDLQATVDVLAQAPFEKSSFKRAFNAFADNVYYERNDPDRANLYLLGGAVPTNKQTIQYLYRNEALDSIELLRSELTFLIAEGDSDVRDALAYHDKATAAFKSYLALLPEDDIRDARRFLLEGDQRR